MNDYEQHNLNQIEKQIDEQYSAIDIQTRDEFLSDVRPKLKAKHSRSRSKTNIIFSRFITAATCLVLLVGIGLAVWLTPASTEDRYEESDIITRQCEDLDLQDYPNLFLPNLDILINTSYILGEHKESSEKIYFIIDGINSDSNIIRHVSLTIILQTKYNAPKEEQYSTDNKINILDKEISIFEEGYDEPFYNYKLGFKINNIRYHIDYQTTSSINDIDSFMRLFLN